MSSRPRLWLPLLSAACGGGGGEGGGGDGGGSDCPAFARIEEGSFSRIDVSLAWRITIEEMPAALTFDQEAVQDNRLEYEWSALVDAQSDGTDDYRISVLHFKTGRGGETTGEILENTQQNVWRIVGATASVEADAVVNVDGRTFVLAVREDEMPGLAASVDGARHHYHSWYDDGVDPCEDEFP